MLKYLFVLILGLSQASASFAQNDHQDGYRLKKLKPEFVFIPTGFDSNDNVQITLYGVFTDVCHKVVQPKVSVDRSINKVYINHYVNVRETCTEMYVNIPYTTTVNLGTLQAGQYEVLVNDGHGYKTIDRLMIRSAAQANQVDELHYAQITSVSDSNIEGLAYPQVTIQGMITNTCLSMKEIKLNYNAKNVVDILPILNVRAGACAPTRVTFTKTIQLNIPKNRPSLLNIRSAGGQATLHVIDPRETIFTNLPKPKS